MSTLNKNNFHTPLSGDSQVKLMGHLLKGRSEQAAAADAADGAMIGATPLTQRSNKFKLEFFCARLAAAGESMSVDVLRAPVAGGAAASILTAPFVYDNTKAIGWHPLPVAAGTVLNAGDIITVTRDYTAGGGPTPIGANVVQLEPS
jgi:hypothetical protein